MKVLVCLPSRNEAHTIGSVTKIIDRGLQLVPGISSATIVNMDSCSTDGTRDIFGEQDTVFPKVGFVPDGLPGKGRNIMAFVDFSRAAEADFCITIDSDITSATENWVSSLLDPLIRGEADYVTPLYARSRFEGSTTNHFAYPALYAFTGRNVRQPIAGDFAFNAAFLGLVNTKIAVDAVYGYGIDIFLSLTAAMSSLKLKQVSLGKKIHGPSFNKLELMFPQVAASALAVIRNIVRPSVQDLQNIETPNILESKTFPHRDAATEMLRRAHGELRHLMQWECHWLQGSFRSSLLALALKTSALDPTESQQMWVDVLTAWFEFGLRKQDTDAAQLGRELLPFFVVRAVQFWFQSEAMTTVETERAIQSQAEMLRTRL